MVHFKNVAIGIVPIDEQGYTWLVGQYRYTLDQYTWEIPEGGCPLGTDPLETAKRELKEETGIQASEWIQIIDFHTSNSVTDEYGIAYLAKGLSYGEAEPEETESLQLKRVPLQEAIDMVLRGEITDALSMMALMKVHIMRLSLGARAPSSLGSRKGATAPGGPMECWNPATFLEWALGNYATWNAPTVPFYIALYSSIPALTGDTVAERSPSQPQRNTARPHPTPVHKPLPHF